MHGRPEPPSSNPAGPQHKVAIANIQWDETSQMIKNMLIALLERKEGEIESHRKSSAQCMMTSYYLHEYVDGELHDSQPLLAPGIILYQQTADYVLEGLRRCMPFPLWDAGMLANFVQSCDELLICISIDRAAPNFLTLRWIFGNLFNDAVNNALALDILPHAEPCSLHGWQLVKRGTTNTAGITRAAHSLANWFRFWKHSVVSRDRLVEVVSSKYERKFAPRPPRACCEV